MILGAHAHQQYRAARPVGGPIRGDRDLSLLHVDRPQREKGPAKRVDGAGRIVGAICAEQGLYRRRGLAESFTTGNRRARNDSKGWDLSEMSR